MSLINDALKDLDVRQKKSTHQGENIETRVADTANECARKTHPIAILIGVLGVAFGVYGTIYSPSNEGALKTHIATEKVAPVDSYSSSKDKTVADGVKRISDRARLGENVDHKLNSAKANNTDAPPDQQGSSDKVLIEHYLNLAEIAFEHDNLTRPTELNAYALFNKVLSLDMKNEAANNGIKKIKSRYLSLVNQAIRKNKIKQAKRLIRRGVLVGLTEGNISQLSARLEKRISQNAYHSDNDIVSHPRHIDKEMTFLDEKKSVVKKTQASLENEVISNAKTLIANSKAQDAISILLDFKSHHANAELVDVTLFDIYIEGGQINAAQLLLTSVGHSHSFLPYMSAKLSYLSGDDPRAITILESGLTSAVSYVKSAAFLAGLYQNKKDYNRALGLYRRLVNEDNNNSMFWLGYAISADNLDKSSEALSAYRKSFQLGGHTEQVNKYIVSRVSALSHTKQQSQNIAESSAW